MYEPAYLPRESPFPECHAISVNFRAVVGPNQIRQDRRIDHVLFFRPIVDAVDRVDRPNRRASCKGSELGD